MLLLLLLLVMLVLLVRMRSTSTTAFMASISPTNQTIHPFSTDTSHVLTPRRLQALSAYKNPDHPRISLSLFLSLVKARERTSCRVYKNQDVRPVNRRGWFSSAHVKREKESEYRRCKGSRRNGGKAWNPGNTMVASLVNSSKNEGKDQERERERKGSAPFSLVTSAFSIHDGN